MNLIRNVWLEHFFADFKIIQFETWLRSKNLEEMHTRSFSHIVKKTTCEIYSNKISAVDARHLLLKYGSNILGFTDLT